jgi:hypothetical protein
MAIFPGVISRIELARVLSGSQENQYCHGPFQPVRMEHHNGTEGFIHIQRKNNTQFFGLFAGSIKYIASTVSSPVAL